MLAPGKTRKNTSKGARVQSWSSPRLSHLRRQCTPITGHPLDQQVQQPIRVRQGMLPRHAHPRSRAVPQVQQVGSHSFVSQEFAHGVLPLPEALVKYQKKKWDKARTVLTRSANLVTMSVGTLLSKFKAAALSVFPTEYAWAKLATDSCACGQHSAMNINMLRHILPEVFFPHQLGLVPLWLRTAIDEPNWSNLELVGSSNCPKSRLRDKLISFWNVKSNSQTM